MSAEQLMAVGWIIVASGLAAVLVMGGVSLLIRAIKEKGQ